MTENITRVTSKTKNINIIDSTLYKIDPNSNIKYNNIT